MAMTSKEKYDVLLEGMAELLQGKNKEITYQRWEIDKLKEQLAAAEKELQVAQDALHKLRHPATIAAEGGETQC